MLDALRVEINVIAASILLLLIHNRRKAGKDLLDERLYKSLLSLSLLYVVCDTVAWMFDGSELTQMRYVLYFVNCLCYLFCVIIPYIWLLYAEFRLYEDERKLTKLNKVLIIPIITYCVLVLSTPFNGWLFTIDNMQFYQRGPLVWINVALSLFYILLPSIRAIQCLKNATTKAERQQCYSIGGFIFFPLIGIATQAIFYGISTGPIATVIAELMVFINIQNEQISLDALTHINNRGQLNRYLNIQAKKDFNQSNMYMLLLDIDRFKSINDTYGHNSGDQALIDMANILQRVCNKQKAFICRYGGDEFAIVIEKNNDDEVKSFIEFFQTQVKSFNDTNQRDYKLSASMGYARFGTDSTNTIDSLIEAADYEMYKIKEKRHSLLNNK